MWNIYFSDIEFQNMSNTCSMMSYVRKQKQRLQHINIVCTWFPWTTLSFSVCLLMLRKHTVLNCGRGESPFQSPPTHFNGEYFHFKHRNIHGHRVPNCELTGRCFWTYNNKYHRIVKEMMVYGNPIPLKYTLYKALA